MGGGSPYLLRVKKEVLVALRVFSLKRSKAGAFTVPFRVRGEKNFKPHPKKQDIGTSWGFFFKFCMSTPVLFIWDPLPLQTNIVFLAKVYQIGLNHSESYLYR